jgi:hypothetical protein
MSELKPSAYANLLKKSWSKTKDSKLVFANAANMHPSHLVGLPCISGVKPSPASIAAALKSTDDAIKDTKLNQIIE